MNQQQLGEYVKYVFHCELFVNEKGTAQCNIEI